MSKIEKQDASTPDKKVEDGLAAKVRKMSETLDNVVRVLEKHFGVDLDKDGRAGFASLRLCLATALLSFVAMGAMALSPLAMTNTLYSIVGEGSAQTNALFDVDKSGNVRIAGTVNAAATQVVTAATSSATVGALTVQTNASIGGASTLTGIATFAATTTVFSAAAVANTNAAVPVQGISVFVNGTNYVIKLYPRTGP